MADKFVTDPKAKVDPAPQTGGVTLKAEDTTPHDPFATSGSEPVRDKVADPSKGTPVVRFFTEDGTPVEPSTLPGFTPSNLAGPDPDKMPDGIVGVVEYTDEGGSTVTHDSLKSKRESEKASKK